MSVPKCPNCGMNEYDPHDRRDGTYLCWCPECDFCGKKDGGVAQFEYTACCEREACRVKLANALAEELHTTGRIRG